LGEKPRFDGLDGLRGLAALAIAVHHAGLYTGVYEDAAGGQIVRRLDVGVPLFFVLSGFLIYRPFVAARLAGAQPLKLRRYLRARALRLLPAYWVALGLVAAVPAFAHVMPTVHAATHGGEWWRYCGLVQIYWPASASQGFPHAWTLCTELSFYVAVPLWALIWRRAHGARDMHLEMAALLAVGVVSWGLRELTYARPQVIGQSFPFELTIGATFLWFSLGMAAAVWSVRRGRRNEPVLPPAVAWTAALVVFLLLSFAAGLPRSLAAPSAAGWLVMHGGYGLVAALLVVPFTGDGADADRHGRVGRFLRSAPLVRLGEISYGFYLWHAFAILALLELGVGRHSFAILATATVAASTILGALSYRLVELPARRLR
jgi:peptidoglycan/LPS O-acetylase OafA/YrhL